MHAGYSYWTLGYIITLEGAKKLLKTNPLEKVIPVDEFLPIAFNKHPNQEWMDKFENRDLIAYSVAPLLIYPTHYTGENGYISDTEDSSVLLNEDGTDEDIKKKGDKEDYVPGEIPLPPPSLEESDCLTNDGKCNLLPDSTVKTDRTEL